MLIEDEGRIASTHELAKLRVVAPIVEGYKEMDVNILNPKEGDDGKNEIPQIQRLEIIQD